MIRWQMSRPSSPNWSPPSSIAGVGVLGEKPDAPNCIITIMEKQPAPNLGRAVSSSMCVSIIDSILVQTVFVVLVQKQPQAVLVPLVRLGERERLPDEAA